jgi:multiple sugar transport system substrate-binding protein
MRSVLGIRLGLACLLLATPLALGAISADAGEKIKVRYPNWQWGQIGFKDFFSEAAQAFEKENPNIQIEGITIPVGQYFDKMIAEIQAGTPADLVMLRGDNYHQFVGMDALEPLDRWMDKTDIKKAYYPEQDTFAVIGGKTYGLLVLNRTLQLLYNKALLKDAGISLPKTQEEFLEAAKKLTVRDASGNVVRYGTALMTTNERDLYEFLLLFVVGYGGNFAKDGKPTATDPRVLEGVKLYKRIFDAGVIPKGMNRNQFRQLFWEGKVAMYPEGSWQWAAIQKANPTILKDVDFAPVPWPNRMSTGGAQNFLAIPRQARHKEEAWKYLELISRPEWQRRYAELAQSIPGRQGRIDAAFLAKYPWFKAFLEGQKSVSPVSPPGLELVNEEFQKIILDKVSEVLFRNRPVDQAMAEAQQDLERLVARKSR